MGGEGRGPRGPREALQEASLCFVVRFGLGPYLGLLWADSPQQIIISPRQALWVWVSHILEFGLTSCSYNGWLSPIVLQWKTFFTSFNFYSLCDFGKQINLSNKYILYKSLRVQKLCYQHYHLSIYTYSHVIFFCLI